jgi:hypothetical protein
MPGDDSLDTTAVVTVFLRHGADVLLCRRSEAVGTYSGAWGGVAGYVGDRSRKPRSARTHRQGAHDTDRSRVLDADGGLRQAPLSEGETYHSPTVFQLKAMLYHAGVLTTREAEPSTLEPRADVWALRESAVQ